MAQDKHVNWDKVKAVILDVDGTLYNQKKLRKKMLFALLAHYSLRPWRLQELLLLQKFRKEREHRAGTACDNLEEAQYGWCTGSNSSSTAMLKQVVNRWIFQFPLQYLAACVYPGTQEFLQTLRRNGVKVGIYSDYKAHDKLAAMGLEADSIVSSTDKEINSLKPQPNGLLQIARNLGVAPEECLFIGDRQELDGVCAERANMPYRILPREPEQAAGFYHILKNEFNINKNVTTTSITM